MNGILNILKPKGITSHDVVYRVRRALGIKKVGHTGTLDPDVTGVLPICIGKGTKVSGILTDSSKKYEATVKLGFKTDTQDITGKLLAKSDKKAVTSEILSAVTSFVGEIEQIPPMYSAVKVNGRKLYELARKGIEVERKPRKITIHSIEVSDVNEHKQTFKMEVFCSKGTYIRTLCNDIGEKLGTYAVMESLVRTKSSIFTIDNSITLDELAQYAQNGTIESCLTPIDAVFFSYKSLTVEDDDDFRVRNGNYLKVSRYGLTPCKNEIYKIYNKRGLFLALYIYDNKERLVSHTSFYEV